MPSLWSGKWSSNTCRRLLQARHDLVRGLDPAHITYSVLDSGDTIGMYTNISESLGVDPYPFHNDGGNEPMMSCCRSAAPPSLWRALQQSCERGWRRC